MARKPRIPTENVLNMLVGCPPVTNVADGIYEIKTMFGNLCADIGGLIVHFPFYLSGNLSTQVDFQLRSGNLIFLTKQKGRVYSTPILKEVADTDLDNLIKSLIN